MRKFWALITGALLLLSVPAFAQQPACIPLEQAVEQVNQAVPVKAVVKLDAAQTRRVVAWFNAQPPATDDKFNFAVIVMHEGALGVVVGNNGEACSGMLVPPEATQSLLAAVSGESA